MGNAFAWTASVALLYGRRTPRTLLGVATATENNLSISALARFFVGRVSMTGSNIVRIQHIQVGLVSVPYVEVRLPHRVELGDT